MADNQQDLLKVELAHDLLSGAGGFTMSELISYVAGDLDWADEIEEAEKSDPELGRILESLRKKLSEIEAEPHITVISNSTFEATDSEVTPLAESRLFPQIDRKEALLDRVLDTGKPKRPAAIVVGWAFAAALILFAIGFGIVNLNRAKHDGIIAQVEALAGRYASIPPEIVTRGGTSQNSSLVQLNEPPPGDLKLANTKPTFRWNPSTTDAEVSLQALDLNGNPTGLPIPLARRGDGDAAPINALRPLTSYILTIELPANLETLAPAEVSKYAFITPSSNEQSLIQWADENRTTKPKEAAMVYFQVGMFATAVATVEHAEQNGVSFEEDNLKKWKEHFTAILAERQSEPKRSSRPQ